jgi:hypothetical protein
MSHPRRDDERSPLALLLLVEIAIVLAWPGIVTFPALHASSWSRPEYAMVTVSPGPFVVSDGCWYQAGVGVACSAADARATPIVEVTP